MEHQPYDTDLSDAEWERIHLLLPGLCSGGSPLAVPRREIVNAILSVPRTGCAWRWLPHDLPCRTLVYGYFWMWRRSQGAGGLAQRGHHRQPIRENDGNPGVARV